MVTALGLPTGRTIAGDWNSNTVKREISGLVKKKKKNAEERKKNFFLNNFTNTSGAY